MSETLKRLDAFLEAQQTQYQTFHHGVSRTSADSAAARLEVGAPPSMGAKALLMKSSDGSFSVCVLPAERQLDSKKLRPLLGRTRFATGEEFADLTGGLVPGTLPPFAAPVLSDDVGLVVDPSLFREEFVAFNACDLSRSYLMTGASFEAIVCPVAALVDISVFDGGVQ